MGGGNRIGFFVDRADAGRRLAQALSAHRGNHALVLGLPRGGVPVAAEVALELQAELDVAMARHLQGLSNPAVIVGAVDEAGGIELNGSAAVQAEEVQAEAARQRLVLRDLRRRYATYRLPVSVRGRLVILVDDGAVSGATLRAALKYLRQERPARLIAAVAVAPAPIVEGLRRLADEVVVLLAPLRLERYSDYYEAFPPVRDEDVRQCLVRLRRPWTV